jgi:hypothetical protein
MAAQACGAAQVCFSAFALRSQKRMASKELIQVSQAISYVAYFPLILTGMNPVRLDLSGYLDGATGRHNLEVSYRVAKLSIAVVCIA